MSENGVSYSEAEEMSWDDLKEANAALDLMSEKRKKAAEKAKKSRKKK